jgi:small subunit ribosomal protein S15
MAECYTDGCPVAQFILSMTFSLPPRSPDGSFYAFINKTKSKMAKAAAVTQVDSLRLHEKDTGSADVQIALLTKRISSLTEHLKVNAKDHASRRGLLKLVATRRSLLDYLKRTASSRYATVLEKLDLRK